MKLKKFKEENKNKNQIIIFTILCVFLIAGVFLYQSFALFETDENFNIISGNIEDPGDISFAFYINDGIVLEAPKSDSGLALDEKSSCTNGVNVSWNVETWNAKLDYLNYKQENTSKVKCNLYFRDAEFSDYVTSCGQNNTPASECMKKYAGVDTVNLAYDETPDNNLRYVGANPNNYVWFNEELWRIIGVMENIKSDETDTLGKTRLKLIRSEEIGAYSWDTSSSGVNGGYGVNEWSKADVMKLMNPGYESESVGGSLYWNHTKGKCFNDENNKNIECDFSKIGFSEFAKQYISEAVWHTASNGKEFSYENILTAQLYKLERSENIGQTCTFSDECNDTVNRTTKWKGIVGLMYPSDYGYATSGGSTTNKITCLNTILFNWNEDNVKDCRENDWLYKNSKHQWTLNPITNAYTARLIFTLYPDGHIRHNGAYYAHTVTPVVYLKTEIKITSGNGAKSNPYRLYINKYE